MPLKTAVARVRVLKNFVRALYNVHAHDLEQVGGDVAVYKLDLQTNMVSSKRVLLGRIN